MLMVGYFKLYRKVFKYAEKPFTKFEAWVWMLANAEYENGHSGKFITSYRKLGQEWGVGKNTAKRWVDNWETEGRLTQKHGPGFGPRNGPRNGPGYGPGYMEITLCNYQKLQDPATSGGPRNGPRNGPGYGPGNGPLLRNKEELSTNKVPPLPPVGGKSRRPRTSPEESKSVAEEAIDSLDLEKFKAIGKYSHLSISDEHFSFKNHHLSMQANYHGAKKITDWNAAFHKWCNAPWKKPKLAVADTVFKPRGGWAEEEEE